MMSKKAVRLICIVLAAIMGSSVIIGGVSMLLQ